MNKKPCYNNLIYMQNSNYQVISILIVMLLSSSYIIQDSVIDINDDKVLKYLLRRTNIDKNKDGLIQKSEALLLKSIEIDRAVLGSMKYLSEFENLESLDFRRCNFTSEIKVQNFKKLEYIGFVYCDIPSILIKNIPKLEHIGFTECSLPFIHNIDVEVRSLLFYKVDLKHLTFANVPNLKKLECFAVGLIDLDVSGFDKLESLLYYNSATCDMKFANNKSLNYVFLRRNNMSNLNTDSLYNITELNIVGNDFDCIDLEPMSNLRKLSCRENQLTNLDFSGNKFIRTIVASENKITSVQSSNLMFLEKLDLSNSLLKKLDLRNAYELNSLKLGHSSLIEVINIENSTKLSNLSFGKCPELKTIRSTKESRKLVKEQVLRSKLRGVEIISD
jgi:hypothetical protein